MTPRVDTRSARQTGDRGRTYRVRVVQPVTVDRAEAARRLRAIADIALASRVGRAGALHHEARASAATTT